ncbi:hypothetical protein K469DRAFT_204504 [Zopfia rhizophila CBS 207.26]|uniref:DUF3176 domain containing protein n=1 Tax=Zopfia rhizophila CBS 207.26 TaxID=1314779 RepID=A0A6A6DYY6_9PEZI|nr:hypothetical protein K469DRAFT_204504 [Zopfia rhizophila CBS 207.26]
MSSPSQPFQWPRYPAIPIFLDTRDKRIAPKTHGATEQTPNVPPTQTASRRRSIHYCTVASPNQPRNCPLKVPNPETTGQSVRPQTGTDGSHSLQKADKIDSELGSDIRAGLGIVNTTSNLPSITIKSTTDKEDESSPNIAQRIEKRLWQYNSSRNVAAQWLLEIISWVISAICMSAIIGVLSYLKDERLPKWPLNLTLNAYIAILSKVASAALVLPISEALGQLKWSWFQGDSKKMWDFEIFDNASRGPWGSFLLLIHTKCKTLAALGAAVTLLSLALDPFFQQVVDFPGCWTLQGNSSIPKVTRYEPHYGIRFREGEQVLQQDQDIQKAAEKFFYDNGTQPIPFGNGTRPDIPLSCPTSNCTWPPYETLGICSACADVSQLLTHACLTTKVDWFANLTGVGTESTYPNGTVCGYFLNATSNAPVLMSGYSINPVNSSAGEALVMRILPLIVNPSRRTIFGGSINFKHIRNPITDFLIVGAANGSPSVYRNETPVAHECVLSWCVKTIKSSYYWANYAEEVTDTYLNTTAGPYPWQTTRFEGKQLNGTRTFYLQNITVDASSAGHNTSNYGVSNVTALQTILIFDDIFPSFTTVADSSAVPFLRSQVNVKGAPMLRSLEVNPWIAPNNVTRHVERLATALTNVIRSSSSNEMVLGMAFSKETYVSVRWEWLSLPLSLLVLSLIFLVGTVIKSTREKEQVGIWKTSAIATLLYGLPDDMQKKITASTSVGTPRARAKALRVKLLPKKGWRVSGNLFSPMTPKVRQNPLSPGWI